MKAFPFTGALLTSMLAAGSALAADLVKAPVAAAVVFDWTRPYLGLNLGYSLGGQTTDGTVTGALTTAGVVTRLVPVPLFGRANLDGVDAGAQLGYNWLASRT